MVSIIKSNFKKKLLSLFQRTRHTPNAVIDSDSIKQCNHGCHCATPKPNVGRLIAGKVLRTVTYITQTGVSAASGVVRTGHSVASGVTHAGKTVASGVFKTGKTVASGVATGAAHTGRFMASSLKNIFNKVLPKSLLKKQEKYLHPVAPDEHQK